MKKLAKYFAIIIPLFVLAGIQIGIGIVGGLIYCLFNIIAVFCLKLKVIVNGNGSSDKILNEVVSINTYPEITQLIAILATIISIFVFYIWVRRYDEKDARVYLARVISVKNISLLFLLGLGCRLFQIGSVNLIFQHFENISSVYNNMMNQLFDGNQIILLVKVVLLAPILEELIFRGVIFKKSCRVLPFIGANILQAALFSLSHMNIVQGIYTFVSGLLLGYVAYRYKTIVASIILHMVLNIISYLMIIIYPSSAVYIIYASMGFVLLVVILKIIKNNTKTLPITTSPS